jgi:hypothetical protein
VSMQLLSLTEQQLIKQRRNLIQFFRLHGDHRITKDAYNWIKKASQEDLGHAGTIVLCAVEERKIVGVLIAANYGIDESLIAVHKKHRNKHTAKEMVQHTISLLGKLYGRVALDNIPSLKVCLENQMVAFRLFEGPTGKKTLWLGGGAWKKDDVLNIE